MPTDNVLDPHVVCCLDPQAKHVVPFCSVKAQFANFGTTALSRPADRHDLILGNDADD